MIPTTLTSAVLMTALAACFAPAGPTSAAPTSPGSRTSGPGAAPVEASFSRPESRQRTKGGKYGTSFEAPTLFLEGEPFRVRVVIECEGDKPAKLPVWLLTQAAWLVDSKPLIRRDSTEDLELQPGQSLAVSLDLGPALKERFGDDPRDFRLNFAESGKENVDVIFLGAPERGIDFETLPKEQLGNYQVLLQTTGGPIWLEMWPEVAPNHVRNFLDLCSEGFYDGSAFYRVIPLFMIQGGRAKDGTAAPRTLDAEFSSRKHVEGVLSAARLPDDINSATSEFFITHRDQTGLDGKYSAFGRVISGMKAVDAIARAVEPNQELVNKFSAKGVRIDANTDAFKMVLHEPNPPQVISQALVVKATKSRPKAIK